MSIEYEKSFKVEPIYVKHMCPFCENGEMQFDAMIDGIAPMKHKCKSCDGVLQLTKQYPYIKWEPGDEIL